MIDVAALAVLAVVTGAMSAGLVDGLHCHSPLALALQTHSLSVSGWLLATAGTAVAAIAAIKNRLAMDINEYLLVVIMVELISSLP